MTPTIPTTPPIGAPNSAGRVTLLAATVLASSPAWAQTVAAPATNAWTASLDNLLTVTLTALAPVVAAAIVGAAVKLITKLGGDISANQQAALETKATAALNVGITQNLPEIEASGWSAASVRNAILADATTYMKQRFPDQSAAIVKANAPASTGAVTDTAAITQTLAARLPDAITKAAASPGTPSVTVPGLPR